ncbi:MAG TPA: hypothetical protein DHV14_10115 [Micrococcales bacterium]|uniref:phosphatase PAP2 family protein n=1 Tax=Miniimonas arenae TaxID=676201 RepID=UPI000EE7D39E|nr:phosphatase PAP2 family protein [Miniimonas arenae]HCX85464.1 hypothetical protein [Micrococcales bacterium]
MTAGLPTARHRIPHHHVRRGVALALTTVLATGGAAVAAAAAPSDASPIAPREAAYGFFVDAYSGNTAANMTVESNPAIGVLAGMLDLWQPRATWDTGVKLDADVLDANIARNVQIAADRTEAESIYAYLIDRRNQSYSAIDGLGENAAAFRAAMQAGTTIPDEVPADASTVVYNDLGNANGQWADTTAPLGSLVRLVNTVRGDFTTSNNAKNFYSYPRPFRWVDDSVLIPSLLPRRSPDSQAATDGGFPSGHTNAAFMASLALADAVPSDYSSLVENAAAMGHSRIVAGFHSSLDVISGRMLGTALAAAVLNNPASADVRTQAHADTDAFVATLGDQAPEFASQAEYEARAAAYEQGIVEGFAPIGDTTVPAVVPKGAEVLLETRLPYLDADQRRWVLQSTALPSGYPVMDDVEGWGRLNLFAAANGFGAFDTDVAVTMSAEAGGFSAADTWRNDIAGSGSLTLSGTGVLTLAGANSYTGGTYVDGGNLVAESATALGGGDVTVSDGELAETSTSPLHVAGDLALTSEAGLRLTLEVPAADPAPAADIAAAAVDASGALAVDGAASLGGTLTVDGAADLPVGTEVPLVSFAASTGTFSDVVVPGLPADRVAELRYAADGVTLAIVAAAVEPTPTAEPSASPTQAPTQAPTQQPTSTATASAGAVATDPAAADPADPTTAAASGSLASTGASGMPALLLSALVALGLGSALLTARRRRSQAAPTTPSS